MTAQENPGTMNSSRSVTTLFTGATRAPRPILASLRCFYPGHQISDPQSGDAGVLSAAKKESLTIFPARRIFCGANSDPSPIAVAPRVLSPAPGTGESHRGVGGRYFRSHA